MHAYPQNQTDEDIKEYEVFKKQLVLAVPTQLKVAKSMTPLIPWATHEQLTFKIQILIAILVVHLNLRNDNC